jgi:hypothetical protein
MGWAGIEDIHQSHPLIASISLISSWRNSYRTKDEEKEGQSA